MIGFSTFLLGCVDYSLVHKDGTGRLSDLVVDHCVSRYALLSKISDYALPSYPFRFSGFSLLIFICFGVFYCIQIFDFVRGILRLVDMYKFYTHLLEIPDVSPKSRLASPFTYDLYL